MRTGGMRAGQVAIMVLFALSCFALLLFLWLSFGGPVPLKPKGYRVQAQFNEATTLATEADVRISGVPIGRVKTIKPDSETGRSRVTMQIDAEYAPLRRDVKAILRQKTLLGETYVELTPGSAKQTIPEDGTIPDGAISDAVQLDEVFRAFDPSTRKAFQNWMQTQSQAFDGRGEDINAAFGNLGPFAEEAGDLVSILRRQQPAVQSLVSNTGEVFDALSQRTGQLRSATRASDRVFRTTSRRANELQQIFQVLPTFQREARATLASLDRYARNTDPLVTQLRPAARELSPVLNDLRATAPDLKAFFVATDRLITASKTGFPATSRLLDDTKPLLRSFHPFANELIPILNFLKPYKRELTAFFANVSAATNASTSFGAGRKKYLRVVNPLNPELLSTYPRRIGSNRPNAYAKPGIFDRLDNNDMPSFETRQCGRGTPRVNQDVAPQFQDVVSDDLLRLIEIYVQPRKADGTQTAAPPCVLQDEFDFQGRETQFPRVERRQDP